MLSRCTPVCDRHSRDPVAFHATRITCSITSLTAGTRSSRLDLPDTSASLPPDQPQHARRCSGRARRTCAGDRLRRMRGRDDPGRRRKGDCICLHPPLSFVVTVLAWGDIRAMGGLQSGCGHRRKRKRDQALFEPRAVTKSTPRKSAKRNGATVNAVGQIACP
jgi:hypothetical protein